MIYLQRIWKAKRIFAIRVEFLQFYLENTRSL